MSPLGDGGYQLHRRGPAVPRPLLFLPSYCPARWPSGHLDLSSSPPVIPELPSWWVIITNVYQGPTVCLLCAGSSQHGSFVFCAASRDALGFLTLVPLPFALFPKALSGSSSAWMGTGRV